MKTESRSFQAVPLERGAVEGLAGKLAALLGAPFGNVIALLGHGRTAPDILNANMLEEVGGPSPVLDHVAIWCPPIDAESWRVDLELEESSRLGVTVMHTDPGRTKDVLQVVADYLHLVILSRGASQVAPGD